MPSSPNPEILKRIWTTWISILQKKIQHFEKEGQSNSIVSGNGNGTIHEWKTRSRSCPRRLIDPNPTSFRPSSLWKAMLSIGKERKRKKKQKGRKEDEDAQENHKSSQEILPEIERLRQELKPLHE